MKKIGIHLDESVVERLTAIAEGEGRSQSDIVREALLLYE
jgi:predicted transcriptional regulator